VKVELKRFVFQLCFGAAAVPAGCPVVNVVNNGLNTETFDVTLQITARYSQTITVNDLPAGTSAMVNFNTWTAPANGIYDYQATAPLAGDANPADNTLTGSFFTTDLLWQNWADIPMGSYLGSAASYRDGSGQGHIVTSGGNTTSGTYNEVYDYNANTNVWTYLTSLPAARRIHASAIVGNCLYIIGGSDGVSAYQSTVFRYDLVANLWAAMSPLPGTIGWCKAVPWGSNYIYLAGGYDGTANVLSSVYLYNISADTWTACTSMPGALFGGAFARIGNTLVWVAGADQSAISNVVYVGQIDPLNPNSITWSSRSTYPGLPNPVSAGASDLLALEARPQAGKDPVARTYPAGSMYRFDGGTWGAEGIIVAGGSPSADWIPASPSPVYYYKPATDAWTAYPNLNTPVLGAYMNSVQCTDTHWKAVVASGYDGSVSVATTQVLTEAMGAAPPAPPVVTISEFAGTVTLTWGAVAGAISYRVEGADDPYGTFTPIVTIGTTTWSGPTEGRKFYRVVAIQ
jgi:N-acetylneuraminic acid mutarotase